MWEDRASERSLAASFRSAPVSVQVLCCGLPTTGIQEAKREISYTIQTHVEFYFGPPKMPPPPEDYYKLTLGIKGPAAVKAGLVSN